ncbi:hypothetical protein BH11BAC1_BH11BAC1_06150 [soil metagenome]
MKKLFILFCLFFLFAPVIKASRYDSTVVYSSRYTDGDDCFSYTEGKKIVAVVRDYDSTVIVLHADNIGSPVWIETSREKFYLDQNSIPYMKEDSVSITLLGSTRNVYDSLNRLVEELNLRWDTIVDQWLGVYRISRVYDTNDNLTSELKELFENASQSWFVKYHLQQSFNASDEPLVVNYNTFPDFSLVLDGGYIDSSTYDINSLLVEKIQLIWNSDSLNFQNNTRYFATYNGLFLTSSGNQLWDIYYWRNSNQEVYTYDSTGNDTLVIYYSGDSVSWNYSSRNLKLFNTSNLIIDDINQSWTGSAWSNVARAQYEYAANSKIQRFFEFDWDSVSWRNDSQNYYEYDAADSIYLLINLAGDTAGWDTLDRTIYDYTSYFPTVVHVTRDFWYGPDNWGCIDRTQYYYDTLNRLIGQSGSWCGGGVSGYQNSFNYDSTGFLFYEYSQGCTMGGLGHIRETFHYKLFQTVPFISNTSLCGEDTTTISFQLSGGIPQYSYSWYSQNIIPDTISLVNTIYINNNFPVIFYAEDSLGNISIDTIRIIIEPFVNLGADFTICGNASAVLNSGNSSSAYTYLWQDGSSDSVFTVTSTGQYWVSVTDTAGCINTDTVFVSVFSLPSLNLGNDTSICGNSNLSLNASSGFNSYLWQDNSSDSLLVVSSTGNYWVEVTDIHGCNNSDTISVELYPNPFIYLGIDTTVCNTVSVVLHAGSGFVSYLWQDNSSDSVLIASTQNAGYDTILYTVDIVDTNSCAASDSIVIYFQICLNSQEMYSENFILFPNPVRRNGAIKISGQKNDFDFRISDIGGRVIKYAFINKYSEIISLANINPGVYFFEVIFLSGKKITGKIIII